MLSPNKNYSRINPKLNLGVLASGNGSNFEAIVKASRQANELDASVKLLIVNNNKCGAIERAIKLGVNYAYLDHRKYNSRSEYDKELIKLFAAANVEAIAMAGWMRIVTPTLINYYENRILNIHPSLLPSFKGINSINDALNAGVRITGCTAHIVQKEVDSGSIICQSAVEVCDDDNYETLRKKIQINEHKIFPLAISIAAQQWRNKPTGKKDQ